MKKFGPALLVTAAFIGPGTVTTASMAGASFGYTLVWALLFSVVATFVLQEMASRLGLVTGDGLAQALRQQCRSPIARLFMISLIVCAIGVGNAAYQAGNLTGAALGLSNVAGGEISTWAILLGLLAATLLYSGKYHILERALISLVGLMSVVFIITMFMSKPDIPALIKGAFTPQIPEGALLSVIALIGTTVVPYNLFLHASIVANHRSQMDINKQISNNRMDATLSIGLGGLLTLSIMACAASAFFANMTELDAGNIANQLQPLLGEYAKYFFALGLFSAGLTSAITAPLAAAYAVSGALGWKSDLHSNKFKLLWAIVLIVGVIFASIGIKPLVAIIFAQATNGLLLPIVAIFLLWIMNQKALLAEHRNGWLANIFGFTIVAVVSGLGLFKLYSVFF